MRPSILWSVVQCSSPIEQTLNSATPRPGRSRRAALFVTVLRDVERAPAWVVCHLWQDSGK